MKSLFSCVLLSLFLFFMAMGMLPILLLDRAGVRFGDGTGNESSFIAGGMFACLIGLILFGLTIWSFFLWGEIAGGYIAGAMVFQTLLGLIFWGQK